MSTAFSNHVIAKRPRRRLVAILGALLLGAPAGTWAAEVFTAKCIGVQDGDTIEVLRGTETIRLRLYGIDAPERGQAFSDRAKQHMSQLVFGEELVVTSGESDPHGRQIARVRVGDTEVSQAMVSAGLAWHYTRFTNDPSLAALQHKARTAGRGLWSATRPMPPWEYRSARKSPRQGASSPSVGPYHGNTRSGVFHRATCEYFSCKNCTRVFSDRNTAIDEGFRPCGRCHP